MRIRQQHILIHPISERTILILNIGNITLPKTAGLAPMAGVGDRAFREICKEFGCAYVVSEMASSKGLTFQGSKTEELLFLSEKEHPPPSSCSATTPRPWRRPPSLLWSTSLKSSI